MEDSGTFGLAANQCQVGADDVATAIMSMARGAERELRMGEEAAGDVEVGLARNGVETLEPGLRVGEGRATDGELGSIDQHLNQVRGVGVLLSDITEQATVGVIERGVTKGTESFMADRQVGVGGQFAEESQMFWEVR